MILQKFIKFNKLCLNINLYNITNNEHLIRFISIRNNYIKITNKKNKKF